MVKRLRKLLDILGNATRCRILDLVSDQPRFISEISRELEIGQQAILRHLAELENFGLLASFEEEEDEERKRKGRKRKYYEISPDVQYRMFINIDKDDLIFDLRTQDALEGKHLKKLGEIEEQMHTARKLRGYPKYERIRLLIKQVEEEIYHLDEARAVALRLLEILKSEFE
jgi:predicted transcriptional regulator